MRFAVGELLPSTSHGALVFGSVVLLLSGLIQLAITWMQMQYRAVQQCSCSGSLPASPNFEEEYSASLDIWSVCNWLRTCATPRLGW